MKVSFDDDSKLLKAIEEAAMRAADRLLELYSNNARPRTRREMMDLGSKNEAAAREGLQSELMSLRPNARWLEETEERAALPLGEYWAVDSVEGNVNHAHGLPEWAVTITLLRDREPVLSVVRQPIGDLTYTALKGGGAYRNGERLKVSEKVSMDVASVATGQAGDDSKEALLRLGSSFSAMLGQAFVVRASVPSTFPMLSVAAGQSDVFWQYEPLLAGIAAGILFIREAGGVASRIDGSPWAPGSPDLIVSTPGLHAAAVAILTAIESSEIKR